MSKLDEYAEALNRKRIRKGLKPFHKINKDLWML